MSNARPWLPQQTVGRYQLLTPLASGGMAEIWLARQPGVRGFEKLVVIKRMVGALEDDPEHVEMFLSEARLAAKLTHPHVVQIYELGEDAGSFFIAMEFVDGESVSTVFKEARKQGKQLSDQLACRLMAWAAEGLHYAHTRVDDEGRPLCIVHRDVSPQNLLVTMDGTLKVVDFGIAKVASHATSSGKLKGKLAYMAPEQGRAEAVDARSDVFALGVCLFELLSRTRLFPGADEMTLLKNITSMEEFPRVRQRRADIPPELDSIVAMAMAPDPALRFQSARDFQLALDDWLVTTSSRTTSGDVADFMRALFADRIATRKALIDAARKGELTPSQLPSDAFRSGSASGSSSAAKAPELSTGGFRRAIAGDLKDGPLEVSITIDDTRVELPPPAAPKRSLLPVVAVVVLLFGAGGVWVATRPTVETKPVVAEVDAGAVVEPATIELELSPAIAVARLDGAPAASGPSSITPGEHVLEVDAPGFVSERRTVAIRAGRHEHLVIALKAQPPPTIVDAGAPVVTSKPVRQPAVARKGTLRLDTVPWTTVTLAGKKLGDTPLLDVSLPVGRHQLRLVNADQAIDHTVEIEITANEATVKKLRLK
ncbi:MAG: serine/threonine-protein kinase [Myxococcales bacterium]|nr:serine/threonine-protein kinase [Myxococcales bacterium]